MQDARSENDFDENLRRFLQLGQEILSTDPRSHYGRRIDKFRGFQPGFMPLKETNLCVISCYPNFQVSLEGSEARKAEERTLRDWKNIGSPESYETAYRTFLRDFVEWGITKKYVLPVLEEAGIKTDQIAWLQVVKAPLEVRSPRPLVEDLSKRDLTWLREQVELVHSNSVVAHKSHTYLPCLIETKLAEGLIQSSQEFYLRGLLARSEVQPQTYGQTTAEIVHECKAIGSRLREKIRLARN